MALITSDILSCMKLSKIYLGLPQEHEDTVHSLAGGGDIPELHRRAQRICWGIVMADRLTLDIDADAAWLLKSFPNLFVAHLFAAIVNLWKKRPEQAQACLDRARRLLPDGHPWAYLVPTDPLFRGDPPAQQLLEVEPGRVYRVLGQVSPPQLRPFGFRGMATFLRLRSGRLVCINPVPFSEELAGQIRALGEVTHIIAPAKYHNEYVMEAKSHFAKAGVYGVPQHRGYPQAAHVSFDGYLDDAQPLFPGEIDQITMNGIDLGDVFLLDRASRTLIVTDAIFPFPSPAETEEYMSFFFRMYAWSWGVMPPSKIAVPGYQPLMWTDITAYQASLRRALDLGFDNLASSHGSWSAIRGNAAAVLQHELRWLLELSKLQTVGLVLNFVKQHPYVFWKFLMMAREQAKNKTLPPSPPSRK